MLMKFTVHTEGLDAIKDKLARGCSDAEHKVATAILSDTDPYVPFLNGVLSESGRVVNNYVIWGGKFAPYARYLYYGKVMVDRATGKGPMRIVSQDGTEVIRFRKGAKLTETSRDLNIQRSRHPKAQSHWFEASKAKNLPKWLRVAKEATLHEFK